jgi:hypothetical protein
LAVASSDSTTNSTVLFSALKGTSALPEIALWFRSVEIQLSRVQYNTQWLAMLAARFGVAYDRFLLYGKAGGGWAENRE